MLIIGGFQVFTQVYIMTRGGPGTSTEVMTSVIFKKAFQNYGALGSACAMAWLMFAVVFVFVHHLHEDGEVEADIRLARRGASHDHGARMKRFVQIVAFAVLIALVFAMVMPYIWMAVSSFKSNPDFTRYPNSLSPITVAPPDADSDDSAAAQAAGGARVLWKPTLENYAGALESRTGRMGRYLFNSLVYASTVTLFQLIFNSLAAYAFARLKFRGRDVLFTLLLATMMLPGAVTLVPTYLIAVKLGLADTLFGVVGPSLAGVFGIFLLRQFFLNIPADLEASARIDGCSTFGTYWRIVLPLAKPALVTLGVFVFMAEWNSFVWPLVILSDWDKYPVSVGVALFRDDDAIMWPKIFAASILASAPLIALFLAAQKYIVGGIALSGLKGG